MRAHVKGAKAIALAEAVLLGALAVLSSGSAPPAVAIPSVPSLEEGTVVRVSGHVVDIWAWDDGTENLVLADMASGATLRVVCRAGAGRPPSEFASIGDVVRVTGEVARSGVQTMLIVEGEGVEFVSASEKALGLDDIAHNWALFEGDEIAVCGLLVSGTDGTFILSDFEMSRGLRLSGRGIELTRLAGQAVVVTGVLGIEQGTMSLELRVEGVTPMQ